MKARDQVRQREERGGRSTGGRYRVAVILAALVLALVVVLLPLQHRSDFVSDVISMVILIGALTFARVLDRRNGVIVALLAGAVAAWVPGVPTFPPSSGWEGALRLGAFVTMTLVYYRVITTLRAHDERAQRQLSDLRVLHREVRALHIQATVGGGTRDDVYRQIVTGATCLVGAPCGRLVRHDQNCSAWQVLMQVPEGTWWEDPVAIAPLRTDDAGMPSLVPHTSGRRCITVPIATTSEGIMVLEVASSFEYHDHEGHMQLLAVYARDVHLMLEHIALQEQLAQLVRIEERGRIARELHDGLVQSLGGIAYRIEYYSDVLCEENVDVIRGDLSMSAATVRSALREARMMIHGLRDIEEQSTDLRARLLSLLDAVARETAIAVIADLPPVIPPLAPAEADTVFRVAQEALQNAVKHAAAESVSLVFLVERGHIEMTVTDDGCGFVYRVGEWNTRPLRYGLVGMVERATQHEGQLTIQTQPEMGTCITLTLPVNEEVA